MRREGLNPLPYNPNSGGGGGGDTPITDAVTIENDPNNPIPVAGTIDIGNAATVNKFGAGIRQTRVFMISAAGDNVIITPTAGMKLRVFWVGYSSSETNTMEVLASLRFGNGPDIYGWFLGAPGAFSHWEPLTAGNVGDPLIINLSHSQPIQVNITFEEIE